MFKPGTKLEPYYVSALILKRVESAFKKGSIDHAYKAFKYHIVFLTYQFYMNKMQLQKISDYEEIISDLSSSDSCNKVFDAAINSIKQCLNKTTLSKHDATRSKAFTDKLHENLKGQVPQKHVTKTSSGRVKSTRR